MDLLNGIALVTFVLVYALVIAKVVHRALATAVGAAALALVFGTQRVLDSVLLEVLLVAGGLMVVGGALRRSGIAAWLALNAAKLARGRPGPILVLSAVVTFVLGALVGPFAVLLVVPVVLVMAVELDVDALPFVVVLTWAGVLGASSLATAQPGNLWLAVALGIEPARWFQTVAPLSSLALVITILVSFPLFHSRLRVTNERRARVLEYDASKTLANRPLVNKTAGASLLVAIGFLAGGLGVPIPGAVVAVLGATVLMLLEGRDGFEKGMADLDAGVLGFFGGLFVVASLGTAGVFSFLAPPSPGGPVLFGLSAVLSAFLDQGAVLGALVPFLRSWAPMSSDLWVWAVVGATVGSAVTVWGSTVVSTAVGLASQGRGTPRWKDYTLYSLVLAMVNLGVLGSLLFFRG